MTFNVSLINLGEKKQMKRGKNWETEKNREELKSEVLKIYSYFLLYFVTLTKFVLFILVGQPNT